jgi:hypothetical protein
VIAVDATIAAMPTADRALVADLWQQRASSESSVRGVMEQLVAELRATGAHRDVIELAERAAADEARHAEICAQLASAYHGTPIDFTVAPAPRVRLPDYGEGLRMRAALHAVNLCCISETIASAFVEACLDECAGDALREIHGRHLADEIRHARIGWAHVATLTPAERSRIADRLPELLGAQVLAWENRIGELPEHGVPGHGYPARAALIATVRTAVRELVLPGFDYVEVDTTRTRAWFDAHVR